MFKNSLFGTAGTASCAADFARCAARTTRFAGNLAKNNGMEREIRGAYTEVCGKFWDVCGKICEVRGKIIRLIWQRRRQCRVCRYIPVPPEDHSCEGRNLTVLCLQQSARIRHSAKIDAAVGGTRL